MALVLGKVEYQVGTNTLLFICVHDNVVLLAKETTGCL